MMNTMRMHNTYILIGPHVWSYQNDFSWMFFSFVLSQTIRYLKTIGDIGNYPFLSVTLKDMSILKVTT